MVKSIHEQKPVKLAFYFPGQASRKVLNIDSLKENRGLEKIVKSFMSKFEESVGRKFAAEVLEANEEALASNTVLAQLRSFYESTIMWMAFMKTSFDGEPPVEELMKDGIVSVHVSGHSLGFAIAAHAPGPGHINDQLENSGYGAKSIKRRSELMQWTIHDYNEGGMAAVTELPGGIVNRLVGRVNKRLQVENLMQLVNHNAPRIKVVAGPREGLNMMSEMVPAKGGKFHDRISPYWFHHSIVMKNAGDMYGLYLAKEGSIGNPSELLTYVSYVEGEVIPPSKLRQDLARGVWNPVHFYTFCGSSIHGAAHKNNVCDAIVLSFEAQRWLRTSKYVATHLVTNYRQMQDTKMWLMRAINGEVQVGKTQAKAPVGLSPQVATSTSY